MKQKKIDTLIEDIYSKIGVLSEGKPLEFSDELLDSFGKEMAGALKHWATPNNQPRNTLRMSNIGRPLRRLWYDIKDDTDAELISPSLQIKFLYGHLLEVLLLFFVKLSGHKVTDEQKEVKVSGIMGHMDCKIDGEVIDVKTASGYSFKKFKEGTLGQNDSFGYLSQLAGYEEAEKTNNGGFLVMNKETGELTTFIPDDLDKPNIKDKIKKGNDIYNSLSDNDIKKIEQIIFYDDKSNEQENEQEQENEKENEQENEKKYKSRKNSMRYEKQRVIFYKDIDNNCFKIYDNLYLMMDFRPCQGSIYIL